jgi:nitrogen fixation/metabolism regulation signal transduction histidine kinase
VVLALLGLSTLGTVLFGLKASSRLAGPAQRLHQALEELGRGNASQRLAFRAKDRLGDLAEMLNRRMLRLDEEQNRLKSEIPFLASSLETCRTDIELGKFPLDQDELRRLENTLRTLAESWHEGSQAKAAEPS